MYMIKFQDPQKFKHNQTDFSEFTHHATEEFITFLELLPVVNLQYSYTVQSEEQPKVRPRAEMDVYLKKLVID